MCATTGRGHRTAVADISTDTTWILEIGQNPEQRKQDPSQQSPQSTTSRARTNAPEKERAEPPPRQGGALAGPRCERQLPDSQCCPAQVLTSCPTQSLHKHQVGFLKGPQGADPSRTPLPPQLPRCGLLWSPGVAGEARHRQAAHRTCLRARGQEGQAWTRGPLMECSRVKGPGGAGDSAEGTGEAWGKRVQDDPWLWDPALGQLPRQEREEARPGKKVLSAALRPTLCTRHSLGPALLNPPHLTQCHPLKEPRQSTWPPPSTPATSVLEGTPEVPASRSPQGELFPAAPEAGCPPQDQALV